MCRLMSYAKTEKADFEQTVRGEKKGIEIGRGISAFDIYLPLGASDGTYDIRIVPRNSDPLFSGNAVATLKAGITSPSCGRKSIFH